MKITLVLTGKTDDQFVKDGFKIFEKRLQHYIQFETIVLAGLRKIKGHSPFYIKEKEAEQQLKYLNEKDVVILLDENGKEYNSIEFASYLQQNINSSIKNLVFIIGGPYGFSDKIHARSQAKVSLSKMTFSHQIIRLLFMEQLYRAFTILRNEPYHNEG